MFHVMKFYLWSKYSGPVGRGYEQRFESKIAYEQRSEGKTAYGPRAKLRIVREQKRAGAESKKCVRAETSCLHGFRHYAICSFFL